MPSIARQITPAEERRLLDAQQRFDTTERQARDTVRQAAARRDLEILRITEAGGSAASIGRALGITRQAVALAANRARARAQQTR